MYKSDIEIAQSVKMKNISEIAETAGIPSEYIEQYGNHKAKIDLSYLKDCKADNGKLVLVDLGKAENIQKDTQFKIIKKGQIRTADSGAGLYYRDDDVLGTITITLAGEEISEGNIENHGFYDRINIRTTVKRTLLEMII